MKQNKNPNTKFLCRILFLWSSKVKRRDEINRDLLELQLRNFFFFSRLYWFLYRIEIHMTPCAESTSKKLLLKEPTVWNLCLEKVSSSENSGLINRSPENDCVKRRHLFMHGLQPINDTTWQKKYIKFTQVEFKIPATSFRTAERMKWNVRRSARLRLLLAFRWKILDLSYFLP